MNAFVKTHVHNFVNKISSYGLGLRVYVGVEVEFGSQDSLFENFTADVRNMNANTTEAEIIRIGERAVGITCKNFQFNEIGRASCRERV